MEFIWNTAYYNWIIDLVIVLIVYGLMLFSLIKTSRRVVPFIVFSISFFLAILSFIFNLQYSFILIIAMTVVLLVLIGYANIGDFSSFLSNPFKKIKTRNVKFGVEKIFDSQSFYKQVESSILDLSKTRTGAIITFEKNQSLRNFIKNGIEVNAPFTPELISTIFYEGTRLHDGAVIVHGNQIVAAAVFFNLTTQPFAVKYGSRHRAAIGISEVSDAITVVVSEETGRISFAVNGELEPVDSDNFLRVFETYMSDETNAVSEE